MSIQTKEDSEKILNTIKRAIETGAYKWASAKSIVLYIMDPNELARCITVNFEVEE